MKVEFFKHHLSPKDIENVVEVLQGLFLTTGEKVQEFEKKLAEYVGAKHAIGVSSCTQALELSLMAYNIGPGDEVITTPMSFMATANCIEYVGAQPIFVDIEEDTGNIDAEKIEKAITEKTRAIIPVHLYGQLCDMKKIRQLADKYNLKIIEDAAHCIEGLRDGYRVGELGDIACYSFYATKNITSGEGGALTLYDSEIADWLRMGRMHGMTKGAEDRYKLKSFQHQQMKFLGLKANMSNIQAALLINQLENIEELLTLREKAASYYDQAFSENPNVTPVKVLPGVKSARHLYVVKVPAESREALIQNLQEQNIGVAVNFPSIPLLDYYQKKYHYQPGSFPISETFASQIISLPLYPGIKQEEQDYVIETLHTFF